MCACRHTRRVLAATEVKILTLLSKMVSSLMLRGLLLMDGRAKKRLRGKEGPLLAIWT